VTITVQFALPDGHTLALQPGGRPGEAITDFDYAIQQHDEGFKVLDLPPWTP
jgi:hypothetical protein